MIVSDMDDMEEYTEIIIVEDFYFSILL